jgi:hypothetical protein
MSKLGSMRALLLTAALIVGPIAASAGIHTWRVREVFSNADGTIQFVELYEAFGLNNETGVGNGTVSSNSNSHGIGNGAVAPPTGGKSYLLATPDFVGLPGAPTPDEVFPAGMVPFFTAAGDTVSFVGFDAWATGAVPTDGIQSRDRVNGLQTNSPKNYAGTEGSIDVSGGGDPEVPMLPLPMVAFTILLVMGVGVGYLMTRRPAR